MAIYPQLGPMGSDAGFVTSPPQLPDDYDLLADIGLGVIGGGAALDLAGTYYGLKARQGEFKTEADNAAFAANQAAMQSRAAQRNAEIIIRAGQQEAARRGAQAAADVASGEAAAAAGGVEVGTGSAAERSRAIRLAAEVDKRTIRTNAERRAAALREEGANRAASSLLGRASAANMRATASSLSPELGAVGAGLRGGVSLIGGYLGYYGRR